MSEFTSNHDPISMGSNPGGLRSKGRVAAKPGRLSPALKGVRADKESVTGLVRGVDVRSASNPFMLGNLPKCSWMSLPGGCDIRKAA